MLGRGTVAAVIALAAGATLLHAQNLDAIKQRREVMRTIAKAGTPPFNMFAGKAQFELSKVQEGLRTYQEQAPKLKTSFPPDSKTGGDTDALPSIWTKWADFEKQVESFVATAKAAASAIKDEPSFKAEYKKVVDSCGGCHKERDGFAPRLADSFKKLSQ
jgi:cytochrome c556